MGSLDFSAAKGQFLSLLGAVSEDHMAQFTIWLDYKLAEYKVNGKIDQVARGESKDLPYPSWITSALRKNLSFLFAAEESSSTPATPREELPRKRRRTSENNKTLSAAQFQIELEPVFSAVQQIAHVGKSPAVFPETVSGDMSQSGGSNAFTAPVTNERSRFPPASTVVTTEHEVVVVKDEVDDDDDFSMKLDVNADSLSSVEPFVSAPLPIAMPVMQSSFPSSVSVMASGPSFQSSSVTSAAYPPSLGNIVNFPASQPAIKMQSLPSTPKPRGPEIKCCHCNVSIPVSKYTEHLHTAHDIQDAPGIRPEDVCWCPEHPPITSPPAPETKPLASAPAADAPELEAARASVAQVGTKPLESLLPHTDLVSYVAREEARKRRKVMYMRKYRELKKNDPNYVKKEKSRLKQYNPSRRKRDRTTTSNAESSDSETE